MGKRVLYTKTSDKFSEFYKLLRENNLSLDYGQACDLGK
jgi:hypothetical protein